MKLIITLRFYEKHMMIAPLHATNDTFQPFSVGAIDSKHQITLQSILCVLSCTLQREKKMLHDS